jgi:hypothetical protein
VASLRGQHDLPQQQWGQLRLVGGLQLLAGRIAIQLH